ncbi:MAG: FHA domain-containing serine/threonine-protein kinase [Planctomycetota bacterium]
MTRTDPLVGQVFSGCTVRRKLGEGGMGSVYLADKPERGEVVVKFLAPEQAKNKTWRARFLREADLLRRTHHPNVVEIYDVDGESDQPHIVMEFVDGVALDAQLTDDGPLPPLEGARVARDVAKALGVAHRQGVIHRDIKPANILVAKDGTVKMLDFGLAKNVAVDDGLSLPGQVLGTPHYMAPEQWGDHAVDPRCDLFSLGSTLYHLVTGSLPFPGHNPQAISRRILEGDFVRPRELEPDIPQDLELVLFRMMEPDRRFRYGAAEQIVADLDKVLKQQPVEIPCLTAPDGTRFPLIPGASFHVGRDASCDVVIADASVSRQHMQIERGKTGFVGRDLGSTYGTFVGGMRVRQVVLKDGDPIKLGKVNLVFKDGGLGPMRRASATQRLGATGETQYVAPPFLQVLAESSDKRAVVYLLEQLAPDAQSGRLDQARRAIEIILGPELAGQVTDKVERRMRRVRSRVPMQLFSMTHENLGDDPEAWLGWWDGAQASYPPQLAPAQPRPRTRLVVLAGEPKQRAIHFDKRTVFTVGREEERDIALHSRSVSRLHATILRLHNRMLIRDEGSRFGTQLNEHAVRIAYLTHGDRITMGKVEMRFEVEQLDPMATMTTGGAPQIDEETFQALEELEHPSIALGLIRFLECEQPTAGMRAAAARLFDEDREVEEFLDKVHKKYARRARQARKILPALLGQEAPNAAGYRALFEAADLTIQLLPSGWFPIRSRS